jgi:hypothetical protein
MFQTYLFGNVREMRGEERGKERRRKGGRMRGKRERIGMEREINNFLQVW